MAYLNSDTTFVEINKSTPMHFRLDKNLIGLEDFKIVLQNKELVEVIELHDAEVKEYNKFTKIAELVETINPGAEKIVVDDSSLISIGDVLRFNNIIFTVVGVDNELHEIFVDKVFCEGFPKGYPVIKVDYPDLLGCYWTKIKISKLGSFIVNIIDKTGTVTPIIDDIQVVSSLTNNTYMTNGGVISSRGIIG